MSYELVDQPAAIDAPTSPLVPSLVLYQRLMWGAVAALATGALWVAADVARLTTPNGKELSLALGLQLASLAPLFSVLQTYLAISHEVDSRSLRKSGVCLYGLA